MMGNALLGCGLSFEFHRAAVACLPALLKTFANVVLGDDRRLFLEELVSAGVVFVVVRVDDEANGFVGDAL